MNKRIKELLKKAQKITAENHVPGGRDYEREIYSKFAELIVTKCAVIATRCESNGTKNIGAEILEHFGVKE